MSNERIHENYKGYVLIVAFRNGKWRGRVAKSKKILSDIDGADLNSVHEELKQKVDSLIDEKIGKRGDASPAAQEYIEAFEAIMSDIYDSQFAMLKAHYHALGRALTMNQLAEAAGYATYSAVNLHYGKLGYLLNSELHLELPTYDDGTPIATHAIATWEFTDGDKKEEWVWIMRPEVAEAMEYLGLHN